ncbi:MAG: acetyl-CoA carboxylase biotin carboxyl carrier protein subunit [Anaerolineae bacterium]|nr:acetyl-CoA carboxylase biotin carboxyl carrier protein subunit [Anaerolineae bacterium]
MTLYNVSFGSREYQVQINGDQATVNGEPVHASIQALNHDGLHLLRRGNRAMELHLSTQDEETLQVLVGGRRFVAHVNNPLRRGHSRTQAGAPGMLTAPMPGLIIDTLVKVNDEVEEGQPLVVMESMKMQMQIRAPHAGKVTELNVCAGQQVEKGALLVKLEIP